MSAAGGPKSDGGLEPTGGVRSSDGGAPRLVGGAVSAAGGPKSDGGLELTGGVRLSDGGAPRLVGGLALGTLELEVEPPAIVLQA